MCTLEYISSLLTGKTNRFLLLLQLKANLNAWTIHRCEKIVKRNRNIFFISFRRKNFSLSVITSTLTCADFPHIRFYFFRNSRSKFLWKLAVSWKAISSDRICSTLSSNKSCCYNLVLQQAASKFKKSNGSI